MNLRLSRLKPLLRWAILGGSLFFLAHVLQENWQKVVTIRLDMAAVALLAIALGVTLFAHICAGWVWSQILQDFHQSVPRIWTIQTYLRTNIAKYLPGNVWHYYGRISSVTEAGASLSAATVSVVLEPILMIASALLIALLCSQQMIATQGIWVVVGQWLILAGILVSIHPRVLNPVIRLLSQLKQKSKASSNSAIFQLKQYPLIPLLGELSFLLLRSLGFLLAILAVTPISIQQIPLLISGFSLAWLLGLVVPGAPGGIGVFEVAAIALLSAVLPPGIILSAVALYRLISVLAEAIGAALATVDQHRSTQPVLNELRQE